MPLYYPLAYMRASWLLPSFLAIMKKAAANIYAPVFV